MNRSRVVAGVVLVVLLFLSGVFWFLGSSNPHTPAGYVGYLTQGAVFGKTRFYGLQEGPVSSGRTWMLRVANVSFTPYTYTEEFNAAESVLASDNLNIGFRIHLVFKMRKDRIKDFMENYSYLNQGQGKEQEDTSDDIVRVAYGNYVKEPLRKFARDEIQKYKGLEVKNNMTAIGSSVEKQVRAITEKTPFEVSSVVVGNIQYPQEVTTEVSRKLAKTQELERKQSEIDIEEKERQKRVIQARGIAEAMEIIRQQLTSNYLQHEAIEAQKAMVNSPNNTVVYIPVGNMGVPLVGTVEMPKPTASSSNPPKQ